MKTTSCCKGAFTWIETLVVVATIALLLTYLMAASSMPKVRAKRINCISNLKQVGFALRVFSNEHPDKFPWKVLMEKGGSAELTVSGDPAQQFLLLTNELGSAKVLACPSDSRVKRTAAFAGLSRSNISYFVCLDANANEPQTILSGDRNLSGGSFSNFIYFLPTQNGKAGWGTDIHQSAGNLGLSDGSAQQVTPSGLNKQLQTMTNETVRSLVP
jgi:hypothetical protein